MSDNDLRKHLELEIEKLSNIIVSAESEISKMPKGTVQIRKHKKGYQFYLGSGHATGNGIYIPAKERQKAHALVQRRYLEQVLCVAKAQLRIIEQFIAVYDPKSLQKVYLKASPVRQGIIDPVDLPDDYYAEEWQRIEYEHKSFSEDMPEHYTQKNERVRSKSEVMIANALNSAGIPYRYEYPVNIGGRILHPDFMILRVSDRKELFWEHLGMMDDPDYLNRAIIRIREFEAAGIHIGDDLILTMETVRVPLNQAVINRTINHYILEK